jgi:hypothetical protein
MKRLINSFAANFGNETVLQWRVMNDGTLKAHFVKNGRAWEAFFEASGKLLRASAVKEKA